MAWIFLPGGLLMPSIVPEGKGDPTFTNNGKWMMQVRARVRSHLTNFIRDYMEDGTYSEIEETPQMDYNFRFYTTHEDLALAVAKSVLDIDYAKFKPTAERVDKDKKPLYEDGKKYHTALNSIWSTVTSLGKPGGSWGAYSSTNPKGYKNAEEYFSYYERPKSRRGRDRDRQWWESEYESASDVMTGSSFLDYGVTQEDLDNWNTEDTLDDTIAAEAVIDIMTEFSKDVGEWFPFLTAAEEGFLKVYATKLLGFSRRELSDVEIGLVKHYFGEKWEENYSKYSEKREETVPFENESGSENSRQNRSQRRKNGRGRTRNKKVRRGVHFD